MTKIADALLNWFDLKQRQFPFRGTHDPYRVWISEIMLQQTRTETVTPYYERFMRAFPDVFALAAASEQEVLKLWEGLGYYSRARNLKKTACIVAGEMNGVFPETVQGLMALPGIGPYTAAAIASIAYDQPIPAMDGNLTRVFSRLYNIHKNVSRDETKAELYALAAQHMPERRSGEMNQALMDLGAGICKPIPNCAECPLNMHCLAHLANEADALPIKDSKKPPAQLNYDVLLIEDGSRICMLQRQEKMLNGLWVFPMLQGQNSAEEIRRAIAPLSDETVPQMLTEAKHVFTHQIWLMRVWHVPVQHTQSIPAVFRAAKWVTPEEMRALPKPSAVRAAYSCALKLF